MRIPFHAASSVAALVAALAASVIPGEAATSSVNVTLTVASAVTLDTSQCATGTAGRTDFGTVLPNAPYVTSTDCTVGFASSNDTAQLRLWQADLGGDAMHPATSGTLLAHWPMNGPLPLGSGGTLTGMGPGGTPLTVGAGAAQPTSVAGGAGRGAALGFDGGDTATAPYHASWDVPAFTVDLWFRAGSVAGFRNFANRGHTSSWNNRQFSIELDSACTCFKANTSTSGTNRQIQFSSAGFLDNQWHHLAYTVDGSRVQRLYLDGTLRVTGAAMPGTVDLPAEPVRIGHQYSPASNFMTGEIDEVRLWSGAATAAEIATIAGSRIPDHDGGAASWTSGETMFGACLRTTGGGLVLLSGLTWATGACTANDGTGWHDIADRSADANALVARRTAGTAADATVGIRFGANLGPTVRPGRYTAPIVFEALAPDTAGGNSPPNVPALMSPADGANGFARSVPAVARFSDPDASDTGRIEFELCYDPACSSLSNDEATADGIANGADGVAMLLCGDANTTHYWRARAVDNSGAASAWSATRSYSIGGGTTC